MKMDYIQNDFLEGFYEWLDSEEGETSMEAMDIVFETLENAKLDLKSRKIIWPDGSRLTIRQTIKRIHMESGIDMDPIESHVIAWMEMDFVPEGLDEKQMEIFEYQINDWVNDHRNANSD